MCSFTHRLRRFTRAIDNLQVNAIPREFPLRDLIGDLRKLGPCAHWESRLVH